MLLDPEQPGRVRRDARRRSEPVETHRDGGAGSAEDDARGPERRARRRRAGSRPADVVPAWLLAGLACSWRPCSACAGYLVSQPSDDSIATATSDAQGAAEQAVDHDPGLRLPPPRRGPEGRRRADDAGVREEVRRAVRPDRRERPGLKAIVTADVVASGIVRSGSTGCRCWSSSTGRPCAPTRPSPTVFRDQVVHDHGEVRRRLARRRHGHQPTRRVSSSRLLVFAQVSGGRPDCRSPVSAPKCLT